jgi:hypothetical protein
MTADQYAALINHMMSEFNFDIFEATQAVTMMDDSDLATHLDAAMYGYM